jgi:hypothetical protein
LKFYQKHKMSNYLIGPASPIKLILRQRVFDNLLRPKTRLCHRQHSKPIERKLPEFFVPRRHLLACGRCKIRHSQLDILAFFYLI